MLPQGSLECQPQALLEVLLGLNNLQEALEALLLQLQLLFHQGGQLLNLRLVVLAQALLPTLPILLASRTPQLHQHLLDQLLPLLQILPH